MILARLTTVPTWTTRGKAVWYVLDLGRGKFSLTEAGGGGVQYGPYDGLERLALTLGGIVPWDGWDQETQDLLEGYDLRGFF